MNEAAEIIGGQMRGESMNSLDFDGSREIIARLVADYEAALNGGNYAKALKCRGKLERWLYPLAYWYLQKTEA